ncbi:MAG: leucine-rich repeat domain-containing protein, partial [Christensenellales bacterium]
MKKRYLLVMVMVLLLITSMALIVACDNKDKDPIDDGGSGIIDDGGNNGGDEASGLADISQYLTYELNEDGNSYAVTGLTVEGYNLVRLAEGYTPQKSKLIIPSIYLDKPVTTISSDEDGDYPLFSYSVGLVSVVIPDSVTSIGDYAFAACYSLIEVYNKSSLNIVAGSKDNGYIGYYAKNVYSEERESKLSIDENGFIIYKENNDNILVGCLDKYEYLNVPSGVTKINQGAFCNNKDIVRLTIPESVTDIGEGAFFGCYCLKEIYNKSYLDIVVGSREYGYVGYNA